MTSSRTSSKTGTLPPTNPVLPPCGTTASWRSLQWRINWDTWVSMQRKRENVSDSNHHWMGSLVRGGRTEVGKMEIRPEEEGICIQIIVRHLHTDYCEVVCYWIDVRAYDHQTLWKLRDAEQHWITIICVMITIENAVSHRPSRAGYHFWAGQR